MSSMDVLIYMAWLI